MNSVYSVGKGFLYSTWCPGHGHSDQMCVPKWIQIDRLKEKHITKIRDGARYSFF